MSDKVALEKLRAQYLKLLEIRKSTTCSLRTTPMLRSEVVGATGVLGPFKLRYYQVQGVLHLLMMKRLVLGDATGIGKTVEAIAFLCYLWEKSQAKCVVVCPKSVANQWADEIERFATGIKTFVVTGGKGVASRESVYRAWAEHAAPEKAVLILNYDSLTRDWRHGQTIPLLPNGQPNPKAVLQPGLLEGIVKAQPGLITIFDEATAFKNSSSKRWDICSALSQGSDRVYGLTATLLKNNLIEGFSIYKVIHPGVFTNKTAFMRMFCVTELQSVMTAKGNRKVPIIVGYKNIPQFRKMIDPYFIGRPKHEVSDELPKLITKSVTCELTSAEDEMYRKAVSGVLELGDGTIKDYQEHKAFVGLMYCQQVVNSLSLLKYEGGDEVTTGMFYDAAVEVGKRGSKEEALVELLTGELEGDKAIVYTRFASLVPRLQKILEEVGIKSVAITGDVVDTATNPRRRKAALTFQDASSGVQVIFITDAGGEGINLQAAAGIVFFDAPWSWGQYVQLIGRAIRIGSQHDTVVAFHLIAERPRDKAKDRATIDKHVLDTLMSKKDLIDQVLGESTVGALEFADKGFRKTLMQQLRASLV